MTREQFVKVSFKAYMPIDYVQPRSKQVIECLLQAVNFDEQLLTLEPIDVDYYKDEKFIARCENCSLPKNKYKYQDIIL